MAKGEDREVVGAVLRAFNLLDILSREQPVGVSALARLSNMKKTTVCRLLATLLEVGAVEQEPTTRKFSLGIRLLELGSRVIDNLDVRTKAHDILQEFVATHCKSVLLSVLDNKEVVYIDKISAREFYQIATNIGGRAPAFCTASGKTLLAFLSQEEQSRILGGLSFQLYTEHTISDRNLFELEMQEIRKRGFSIDWQERQIGLCAVAAPVYNRKGLVVAAVSVPTMTLTMTRDELLVLGREVAELACRVSRRLGWSGC